MSARANLANIVTATTGIQGVKQHLIHIALKVHCLLVKSRQRESKPKSPQDQIITETQVKIAEHQPISSDISDSLAFLVYEGPAEPLICQVEVWINSIRWRYPVHEIRQSILFKHKRCKEAPVAGTSIL